MNPFDPTRRQSGFSLVEVLCSILILGVGLTGLTQGLVTALRSAKDTEIQTAAALFAAGKIETLQAEGYLTDGQTEGECEGVLRSYRWRQSLSAESIDGLHRVVVSILDSKNDQVVFELQTLLFERPLGLTETESRRQRESERRTRRGGQR